MASRIKNLNHFMTGIFLILVAIVALWAAWSLSSKTDLGIGPGYVPKVLSVAMIGLGLLLVVNGLLHDGEPTAPWHLRPLVLILSSVVFFALTIERMGLAVALTGLVLLGCAANRGTSFREAISLAVGAVVVSALLFIKALGLSMMLWPPFLRS